MYPIPKFSFKTPPVVLTGAPVSISYVNVLLFGTDKSFLSPLYSESAAPVMFTVVSGSFLTSPVRSWSFVVIAVAMPSNDERVVITFGDKALFTTTNAPLFNP